MNMVITYAEKLLENINFERLKSNLIDSDDNTYFTVDLLIDINNIIAGSNDITLRKVNVKPCGYDKMYIDKDLIEDELYQLVDQFNEQKNNHRDFYSKLLDIIHPFYGANGRHFKKLFVSNIFL